jgi:hypothetical protein
MALRTRSLLSFTAIKEMLVRSSATSLNRAHNDHSQGGLKTSSK